MNIQNLALFMIITLLMSLGGPTPSAANATPLHSRAEKLAVTDPNLSGADSLSDKTLDFDRTSDVAPSTGEQAMSSVACSNALTVQNTNDSGAGSLRQALVDVCPDGRIDFDSSLAGQTITLATQLKITQNVTIDGSQLAPPIQISGNDLVRVFRVTGTVHLALNTLRIVRGTDTSINADCYNYSCGGGIKIEAGAVVTLAQSAVFSSTAQYGGGIANLLGTLTVTNSIFSGNSAVNGGGIYNNYDGTLMLHNSILSGNSAANGGGIHNDGRLTVTNSAFPGNSAIHGGGGGIFNSDKGTLVVTHSILSRNSALWGGGIFNGRTLTVTSTTLSSNSAQYGGGIDNSNKLAVQNSTFSANSAPSGYGGGIYNGSFGTLTLIHSTFSGNSAIYSGGGIDNNGTLHYQNTLIANSTEGKDCANSSSGVIGTNAHNLVQDGSCSPALLGDPLLDALADNGGDTLTHALLPGSPALDAVPASCTLATDQRGVTRPQPAGGNCDIGAFESRGFTLAFTSIPITTGVQNLRYHYAVTARGPDVAAGHPLAVTAPVLPGWLALTDHGDGAATLSGTPTRTDVGQHPVTLRMASSGGLTAKQTFTITVMPATEYIFLPMVLR